MKKFLSVFFAWVVMLTACSCRKKDFLFSAKLFDKTESMLTNEFLAKNQTHYPSIEDGLPDNRIHIITNTYDFETAFVSFPENLDFSKDTLVVYFFTDIYYGFDCELDNVVESNNQVTITVTHKTTQNTTDMDTPSVSAPLLRCLTIKLTSCPQKQINVILNYS